MKRKGGEIEASVKNRMPIGDRPGYIEQILSQQTIRL